MIALLGDPKKKSQWPKPMEIPRPFREKPEKRKPTTAELRDFVGGTVRYVGGRG